MAQGIVLAGGNSNRAQTDKMLLPYQDKALILHTIHGMKSSVNKIYVVTGRYHQEINDLLKNIDNVEIVYNPDYQKGMFSSVQAGVRKVTEDFFIIPGDCPLVNGKTYKTLLAGNRDIRVPSYLGEIGHPIFIRIGLKDKLLQKPCDFNLKSFRDGEDYEIIECDDKNILNDIDTPDDYITFVNKRKD